MIRHSYCNALDNIAQFYADEIGRQEVTVDYYLDNMIDSCFFRWTDDEDALMGLDPWRFYADFPIDPEEAASRGWRIFVQVKDMPEGHINSLSNPVRDVVVDFRTEVELLDAAEQRWNSQ